MLNRRSFIAALGTIVAAPFVKVPTVPNTLERLWVFNPSQLKFLEDDLRSLCLGSKRSGISNLSNLLIDNPRYMGQISSIRLSKANV